MDRGRKGMNYFRFVVPLVALLVLAAGCAKPPQADVDGAKQALETARTAEAREYAPASLKEAEDAVAALDTELAAQEKKFALFRSYKNTTQLAADAKAAGDKAAADASARKEQVKQEATNLIAQARTMHEEAKAMLEKAPKGKGTQADIQAMEADLAAVETALADAESLFAAGKYMQAKTKAEAAMRQAEGVKTAVEAAMAAKTGARGK